MQKKLMVGVIGKKFPKFGPGLNVGTLYTKKVN